jgi:hypothetical protein
VPRRFDGQQGRALSRHPGLRTGGAADAAIQSQRQQSTGTTALAPGARVGPGGQALRDNRALRTRVLRNQLFTNPALIGPRSVLAGTTFRGRFAANSPRFNHRHRFWRGRVLGWYGRTFWPYAYYDMFDYAFWPYAYDTFWPYAYDDVYGGIFGPYAYGYGYDPGYGPGPGYSPGTGPRPDYDYEPTGSVCNDQATSLASFPIERIAETVKPTGAQVAALDQLSRATGRAIDILRASCPTRLPSTPTGRLQALQSRLESMLRAVDTIAPALNAFYQSLNDEQRAQFDGIGQESEGDTAEPPQGDLAKACDGGGAGVALPIDRIEQEVRPSERQRAALQNLANAAARASEILKTNCPTEAALTPVGRTDAMRQRLTAMLDAIIAVRPALEAFYGSLDHEQRARFNVIGADQG